MIKTIKYSMRAIYQFQNQNEFQNLKIKKAAS